MIRYYAFVKYWRIGNSLGDYISYLLIYASSVIYFRMETSYKTLIKFGW